MRHPGVLGNRLTAILSRSATTIHCKNIRISTDILWRVFHILTEPVPCTFAWVDRRNNEAPAHIAVPLKHGKLATKYRRIYGYFYSVCGTWAGSPTGSLDCTALAVSQWRSLCVINWSIDWLIKLRFNVHKMAHSVEHSSHPISRPVLRKRSLCDIGLDCSVISPHRRRHGAVAMEAPPPAAAAAVSPSDRFIDGLPSCPIGCIARPHRDLRPVRTAATQLN